MAQRSSSTPNRLLKHVLILTMLFAFTVMLVGGGWIFKAKAPIPDTVAGPDGTVLTTGEQILGGQAVYQKYGLMDYGSVLGHGSYLGPDYTAEALHLMTGALQAFYAQEQHGAAFDALEAGDRAAVEAAVKAEFLVPGILPLAWLAFTGMLNLRPVQKAAGEAITLDDEHDAAD